MQLRQPSLGMVLAIQCTVAGSCLLLLGARWNSIAGQHVWATSVIFSIVAVWSFFSWRLVTGKVLDTFSMFLLAFVLFSGGQLLLYAIGALPDGPLSDTISSGTVEKTGLIVSSSLAMLHLGALLAVARRASRQAPTDECDLDKLRRIGVAFVAVSLPAMLAGTYQTLTMVVSSGYFSLYGQQMKVGAENIGGFLTVFLTPGLLILLGTRPRSGWNVRFVWAITVLQAVSLLFIGRRAYAAMTVVPVLMLHDHLVRRVNKLLLAGLAATTLFLVFPIVRAVRLLNAADRAAAVTSGVDLQDPLTDTISEMGGSMVTVAHTIELVPATRPYDHGIGLLRAATSIIPNLFWDRHPAAANTYADWLIETVDPSIAAVGGGLGFSMVAEGFINFGPLGAPLFCGVVGFLIAALLGGFGSEGRAGAIIFGTIVLSAILSYPRDESSSFVRAIVWCALVPYLLTKRSRPSDPALT